MIFKLFSKPTRKDEIPMNEDTIMDKPSSETPAPACPLCNGAASPSFPPQEIKPEGQQPSVIDVLRKPLDIDKIKDRYRELISDHSAKNLLDRFEEYLMGQGLSRMPLYNFRTSASSRIIQIKDSTGLENRQIWFVGDLHCDVLGLEAGLAYIREKDQEAGKKSFIVFLGDIFDDDSYNCEIMFRIIELLVGTGTEGQPDFCLLTGNHDESLVHNGQAFSSLVEPSQFSARLNDHTEDHDLNVHLGFLTILLFKHTARAIFFPNGLMATHGGFPLSDKWAKLDKPEDLDDPECLQDFVWTRAHMTAPRKRPNRWVKDSQFGHADFMGFCEYAAKILEQPVSRMIRGHDHIEARYAVCQDSILTINTLSRRLSREVFGEFQRTPCIARYREGEGQLPEVHRLELSPDDVKAAYTHQDKAAEDSHPSATS
jgi:hypothetical protein